jgi:hypothetical protein
MTTTGSKQELVVEQKIQKLRELYADAPELGKVALENGLGDPGLVHELAAKAGTQSAGRVGARQGRVSELTMIVPFAEGGAKRLRGLLQLLGGNFWAPTGSAPSTICASCSWRMIRSCSSAPPTTDEWDPYIDDFARRFPNELDLFFCNCVGWREFTARR